jgi:hypothetical protein
MEKIIDQGDVHSVKFVECTPAQLRIVADRMELAATQRALPGQALYYELTQSIVLIHNPNVTRTQIESRPTQEETLQ